LLVLSYVIPGNIYPVIEQHKSGVDSLLGASLKTPDYHSHYVLTKKDGYAVSSDTDIPVFDELVIAQEAQVVPAFIIKLADSPQLKKFYTEWEREICDKKDTQQ